MNVVAALISMPIKSLSGKKRSFVENRKKSAGKARENVLGVAKPANLYLFIVGKMLKSKPLYSLCLKRIHQLKNGSFLLSQQIGRQLSALLIS